MSIALPALTGCSGPSRRRARQGEAPAGGEPVLPARRVALGILALAACSGWAQCQPAGPPSFPVRQSLSDWLQTCNPVVFKDHASICALAQLGAGSVTLPEPPHGPGLPGSGLMTPALAQELGSRISRDWCCHDVVIIDGWLLARTEAWLCAVAASVRHPDIA